MNHCVLLIAAMAILISNLALAGESSFVPPKLLSKQDLVHPDMNHNGRTGDRSYDSGVVELIYMVDKDGVPKEISVLSASQQKFEQAAIDSIQTYRYKPAQQGGKLVGSIVKSIVIFEINRRTIAFDRWWLQDAGVAQDEEFTERKGVRADLKV